jgi:uncharacterized membrane protein
MQHPDEHAHFLRAAQISDGGLLGYRYGSTAGGRADPALSAALAQFNPIVFHSDVKVTAAMYASAHRVHWSGIREDLDFRNTALYPPFLYAPSVLAIWAGRALDLTVIQTLYLARASNAIASALFTLAALALARRSRCALAAVAVLPMTLALEASASQDALIISLVLLAVGAIDRVIDERRTATSSETVLITLALLFPAMARPPYAALCGLLLLISPNTSLRPLMAASVIIAGTVIWWSYSITILVLFPGIDASAQWAFSITNPAGVINAAWTTLVTLSGELGEELIGVLGWLDTRLPRSFLQLAAAVLLFTFLSTTTGPARRPWWTLVIIAIGIVTLYLTLYFIWASPGAPFVSLQGRYFLPFVAALSLAFPRFPWLGTKILPLAAAGVALLGLIGPAVIIRTLVIRYYLGSG